MTKSNQHRFIKFIKRLVIQNGGEKGDKRLVYTDDYRLVEAPPYHVGKQWPYKNARRALEEGVAPENLHLIRPIRIKDPEQVEREQAYLGRNRHTLAPKRPSGKHGGDGTIRRSSLTRPFRGDLPFRTFRDKNNRLYVVKPVAA